MQFCSDEPDPHTFCQTCNPNSTKGVYLSEFIGILQYSTDFDKYIVEPPSGINPGLNYYIPCEIPKYVTPAEDIAVRITGWTYSNYWTGYGPPQKLYHCIELDTIIIIP